MKASDARKLTEESAVKVLEKLMKPVLNRIEAASKRGMNRIAIYNLDYRVKQRLIKDGYTVNDNNDNGDVRDALMTSVEW